MNALPPALLATSRPRLSRVGLVIALAVIISCVVLLLDATQRKRGDPASGGGRPNVQLEIAARYLVGAREAMRPAQAWTNDAATKMAAQLNGMARTPPDAFRVEIVNAVLHDRWPDGAALDAITRKMPALSEDVAWLWELQMQRADMPAEHWRVFLKRHGWIARLARAQATGWKEPDAARVKGEAVLTASAFVVTAIAGFVAFVIGIVLLVKILLRWYRGSLRAVLQRPATAWAACLLEGFAIYLFGCAVVFLQLRTWLPNAPSALFYFCLLLFVLLALFWPRLRGMEPSAWRQVLGLHRGEGWLCEMKHGVLGWVTGLPLLAVGFVLTIIIMRSTGAQASHPLVQELQQDGPAFWGMVALAVLWAPVTEEAMFRGLLFPGLSSWLRWIVGAFGGALIFAVVHPQGWAAVPAIMAIALTLSALRAFRGSLIAPMTAHALHNGLITALLVVATWH